MILDHRTINEAIEASQKGEYERAKEIIFEHIMEEEILNENFRNLKREFEIMLKDIKLIKKKAEDCVIAKKNHQKHPEINPIGLILETRDKFIAQAKQLSNSIKSMEKAGNLFLKEIREEE